MHGRVRPAAGTAVSAGRFGASPVRSHRSVVAALQGTAGNRATAVFIQRAPSDERDEASAVDTATVDTADPATGGAAPAVEAPIRAGAPGGRLALIGSVGDGGDNHADDVAAVSARLGDLGIDAGSTEGELAAAIRSFQSSEVRTMKPDGRVSVGGATHSALAIARTAGAGSSDADLAAVVEASEDPAVVRLRESIAEVETLQQGIARTRGQEQGTERDELVARIGEIRAEIGALAGSGLADSDLDAVGAWAHRRLNAASPYYEQWSNVDFLETRDATRTCNLTCVAMSLEALGLSSANYAGDRSLLDQVRGHPGTAGKYDYEASFDAARDDVGGGIDGLRLPDFLQLVMVARRMAGGMKLLDAVKQAWDDILVPTRLADAARMFGTSAYARPVGLGGGRGDPRSRHVRAFGGLLDAGVQVVAGLGHHFVRIEAIVDDGLVVDDPAKPKLRDTKVPWDQTTGYIKSLIVIG